MSISEPVGFTDDTPGTNLHGRIPLVNSTATSGPGFARCDHHGISSEPHGNTRSHAHFTHHQETRMNIKTGIASVILASLLLTACGGDIHGTYAKTDSALTIKFDSGKAFVTGLTSMNTIAGTYKVDGDKVTVDGPNGHPHLVLVRNKDGTLHLNGLGGTLEKTNAGE